MSCKQIKISANGKIKIVCLSISICELTAYIVKDHCMPWFCDVIIHNRLHYYLFIFCSQFDNIELCFFKTFLIIYEYECSSILDACITELNKCWADQLSIINILRVMFLLFITRSVFPVCCRHLLRLANKLFLYRSLCHQF